MQSSILEKSDKIIKCGQCKKANIISETDLIQTYWYKEPTGCTEGGYYLSGECNFTCKYCGIRNRLLYDRKYDYSVHRYVSDKNDLFNNKYRSKFKKIVDDYSDEKYYPFTNNYWIDTLK